MKRAAKCPNWIPFPYRIRKPEVSIDLGTWARQAGRGTSQCWYTHRRGRCGCFLSLRRLLWAAIVAWTGSGSRRLGVVALLASVPIALPSAARANLAISGITITVDSAPPNPWTTTIGTGPSTASGTTVTLGPNAQVIVGNANAISLGDNASITLSGGALVKNTAFNTSGLYGTGGNTIEFKNNSTLTVQAGGTVYAAGPAGNAEAVAAGGVGNVIINYGTIRADNAGVFFSDTFGGVNTVINEVGGVIQGRSTTASVIGTYASAANFTNKGTIIGSLSFAGGANDQLHIYTGSTITGAINGGTGGNNLMTLNGTGSDVMSGALTNWRTLIKQDTGTWTLTGSLGNNGGALPLAVEVQAGTLGLTGNNASFNGTMAVDPAGTLQGTSSTLTPAITNNGLVDFVQPTNGTYAGTISGTGAVAKDGSGVLTLTGANTYSGGTIFNAGTVAVSVDSNLGALASPLTFNGGTLQITNSFNLSANRPITLNTPGGTVDTQGFTTTIAQNITGVGALTKAGVGTLTLTGANSYTGGTTITQGTLQLGNGTTNGSIIGNVANSGALAFDPATGTTISFGGVISGSGAVNQIGTGTTVLTGANSYSGGTTITAGTLQIGNGGTAGSITGNVTDNGALAFDRSDSVAFAGIIAGAGGVTQIGTGTTILTGSNTYSGGTTISSGTLQIGNGGTTGSITGNVTDNGTLVFNRSGDKKTSDGVISGSGNVVKLGTDTLVLTANNTYSGRTIIQDGTLVAGVPSSTQTTSFALGTGDVFLQRGTLRTPSLDPLIINVGRNYTQGSNGTLAIGVAGVDGRDYDHVQVQGNASLNGTLAVSSLSNFHPVDGNAFEILRTGGTRSGEFAAITDNLNTNSHLHRFDIYAPNGFTLLYLALPGPPTPPTNDVVPLPLPPIQPDKPIPAPVLLDILDPSVEQLTSIFEVSFSGANTQRFKLDERFDDIQRGSTGFVSNLPPAPPPVENTGTGKSLAEKQPVLQPTRENRWGVWANGWGDWVSVSNDGFAKGYDFTTGGFIIGVDYRITDHFAVGVMGGYAYTATNLQPSGDIDVNTGRSGLYATYFDHEFYINAAAYGGYNSYSTSRQELQGMANGSTNSGEFSIWAESGYDFHFGDFAVGPMGALQYTLVHVDGFSEQGSLLPLQIHSDQEASLRTDLGARASYTWHLGNVVIIPTLTVAWEHEYFYSPLPVTVSSVEFPGQSATLFGPAEGHDSAIINAGAALQFTPRFSTYLGYQGQLGRDHYNSNAVTGGFSFSF